MLHGIAFQVQSSPHTAGSLACEMITVEALDGIDLKAELCFFLPEHNTSFLANIDSK